MNPIISLENVSLSRKGKNLLKDLNWQVEPGQTWAILGLNGAGKSTLLRLLMAEIWPSKGQVQVLGKTFGQDDIPQLRQQIGVVSSFMAERFPSSLLAEELVLTGRYKSSILYTSYQEKELEEARHLLKQQGADRLIGRNYSSLSQGEGQTLLIARSLMDQPDLLILDEATSGLDLFAREALLSLLEQIKGLPQAPTILYVTHHVEEITSTISHLLLLKEGTIAAQGSKEQLLAAPVLTDFYGQAIQLMEVGQGRYYVLPEVAHA